MFPNPFEPRNMPHQYSSDEPDEYLRFRIKKCYAQLQPPPEGKQRLLKAAHQETVKSSSQYSHLNNMIEREDYQDNQVYLFWVLSSRFHMTFLSTIKLQ
jgi:hypothetical protein